MHVVFTGLLGAVVALWSVVVLRSAFSIVSDLELVIFSTLSFSMNCPPTKRFRGLEHNVATAYDDSFGDDGDFTQDDLDEIDVIASQAIATSTAGTEVRSKSETTPLESTLLSSAWHNKPLSKVSAKQSRENAYAFNSSTTGNAGIPNREPLGEFRTDVNCVSIWSIVPFLERGVMFDEKTCLCCQEQGSSRLGWTEKNHTVSWRSNMLS